MRYNLVLSTELTMKISHRKEIRKLTFRALVLRRERIEELRVVCGLYTEGGATLLAGAW